MPTLSFCSDQDGKMALEVTIDVVHAISSLSRATNELSARSVAVATKSEED